ncbi:putative inactive caspase B [Hylaeus anthracinus]|uniref:putative inactive caspase B n=1 Tax=Hylaeus anthracinus TaxID=313031 RepID=UPI0023B9D851|nr:putative inactive caspase B [Hylaeus anthracinus]
MNRKHRETIDLYCNYIVPKIDLTKLWPKLLENKVFNRDDVNVVRWKESLTDEETIRDICLTIKTRGPFAFDRFLESLRQSGHKNLAETLEGNKIKFPKNHVQTNINEENAINDNIAEDTNFDPSIEEQDNFFHNMQLSDVPLQVQVRKATKFLDGPVYKNVQRYPMRSKPRGLVLIITNINYKYPYEEPRSSAVHDEANLKNLFEQMGFEVTTCVDLTGQQVTEKVKEFSQNKDLRKVDSCFVIISSHGNINANYEVTEIGGVDYDPEAKVHKNSKPVLCMDILDYFTSAACPHLAGKPKIFIFQLCRGDKLQTSLKVPRHTTDTTQLRISNSNDEMIKVKMNDNETMRNCADMFVVHATLPGHVAFRDKITGSWFIQILCEVFMNYAHTTHLQDLLNMVDERLNKQRTMKNECQTLMVTSIGFNKHCYLNPGLFEET